jgi:hypothetical protein
VIEEVAVMHHRVTLVIASCMVLGGVAAGAEYQERAVTDGGIIRGSVRLSGDIPALPPQPVYKHADVCGGAVPDERLLTGEDGSLQNAVVHLSGVQSGKPVRRDARVRLDNVKCAFVPHVVSGTVGQTLEIRNSDPFLHDAHAWLGTKTLFNVAVPKGRTVSRPLTEPGLAHINCNVRHTWMHAYLFVAVHPYHAVTDRTGSFALEDVPPGTYKLTVWHELLGSAERDVTVESGKQTTVEVAMPTAAAAD